MNQSKLTERVTDVKKIIGFFFSFLFAASCTTTFLLPPAGEYRIGLQARKKPATAESINSSREGHPVPPTGALQIYGRSGAKKYWEKIDGMDAKKR